MTSAAADPPAPQRPVVVAGEALIDLTPVDHPDGAAYVAHPGGSPYNVAVALGRLEVAVSFLGSLSTDAFGRMLSSYLVDNGVGVDLVIPADEPTAVAFVNMAGPEPEYAFYSHGTATRALPAERLGPLPAGALLHAGSISLVLEPGAATLDTLLRRESRHRLISLDPNIRPGLVADRDAYLRQFTRWTGLVDIVKASAADLAWLFPAEPVGSVAGRILAAGAELVLVTAGADGATAYTGTEQVEVPARPVTVADAVGAGDAFMAAALARLVAAGVDSRAALAGLTRADLEHLLAFGNEVARLTCSRPGSDPPRLAEVAQWLAGR